MPFNFMIKKRKNIFIEIIENKNDYEIVIRWWWPRYSDLVKIKFFWFLYSEL
jgi:hypothetical protein